MIQHVLVKVNMSVLFHCDARMIAVNDTGLFKVIDGDIRRDAAEMLQASRDRAVRASGGDRPLFRMEQDDLALWILRPDARIVDDAGRQPRSRIRKDVPSMERAGLFAAPQPVHSLVDLAHSLDLIDHSGQRSVIGRYDIAAVFELRNARAARRPYARIDNGHEDRSGTPIGYRIREQERALPHIKRPDLMVQVADIQIVVHHLDHAVH